MRNKLCSNCSQSSTCAFKDFVANYCTGWTPEPIETTTSNQSKAGEKMSNLKIELKPCPFCGKIPVCKEDEMSEGFYVVDCKTPMCYAHESGNTVKEAIKNWNTRPIEDDLRRQLEEAQNKLKQMQDYGCTIEEKDGYKCSLAVQLAERDRTITAMHCSMAEKDKEITRLRTENLLMARLSSDKPEFVNPLQAGCAVNIRDRILNEALKQAKEMQKEQKGCVVCQKH